MRSRSRMPFIAALLVVGLLAPVAGRPDARTATAEALTIQELYAPRLSFHPDEAHFPMSSHTFVNNGDLKWSHDGGCPDHMVDSSIYEPDMRGSYRHYESNSWCRHTSTLWRSSDPVRPWGDGGPGGNEGMFINLDNDYRDGQGLGGDEPVYVRLIPGRSLHYFFNYGDSFIKYVPGSHHEGDWEHFAIRLNEANEPVEAQYFYHHDSCTLPWSDVPKYQGQPVLWIARDSHGSYPPGAKTPWYDSIEAGAVWNTRVNVDDIPSLAWYGYAGGWGEVGNTSNTTGPWGPNPHRTEPGFANPLCELSGTGSTSMAPTGTAAEQEESTARRPVRASSWRDQSVATTEQQKLVTQAAGQGSGNRVVAVGRDGTEDTVGVGVSGIALADAAGSVAAWTENRAGSTRLVAYDSTTAEVVSTLEVDPSMSVYAVNGTEVVVADGRDSFLWDLSRPSQLAPLLTGRLVTDLTDEYMFATDFRDAVLLSRDGSTVATYAGAAEGAFDPTGRLLAVQRSGREVTVRRLSSGVEVDVPDRADALRWGGDPHGVASTAFGQIAANSA